MFDPAQYRRRRAAMRLAPAGAVGAQPSTGTPRGVRLRMAVAACGPAFVVSVAYIDPGNFATNMTAGARYGPLLLWVIAVANIAAMFMQYLSAKLGIATGRNLAQLCRERYPHAVVILLWIQAELIAMATDLAEFVGSALALNLLFGIPLPLAGGLTALIVFAILTAAPAGRRRFEAVIIAALVLIMAGFLYQGMRAGLSVDGASGLRPRLAGMDSLLLATGIIGATVMPHVIYLHSALTQRHGARTADRRIHVLRAARWDIITALGLAGLVNMCMLLIAAAVFHAGGGGPETLEQIYAGLGQLLGPATAAAFALALLAAGLASSSVGTYAGQVIMQGFLRRSVPLQVRRLLTMAPALLVLCGGLDPTRALVLSQVALSFGIPFAVIPLVAATRRSDVMGPLVNRGYTTAMAVATAALVVTLNLVLLTQSVFS